MPTITSRVPALIDYLYNLFNTDLTLGTATPPVTVYDGPVTITIHCVAEAWSGVDDTRTMRVAVYAIIAAVETLMQADTTQFGGNVLFPDPGMTTGQLLQLNPSTGALARVPFDLTFRSRIGG